jgi:hypothetical protein
VYKSGTSIRPGGSARAYLLDKCKADGSRERCLRCSECGGTPLEKSTGYAQYPDSHFYPSHCLNLWLDLCAVHVWGIQARLSPTCKTRRDLLGLKAVAWYNHMTSYSLGFVTADVRYLDQSYRI